MSSQPGPGGSKHVSTGVATGIPLEEICGALREILATKAFSMSRRCGGHYPKQAYGFAYMKALKNRSLAEAQV